MKEIMNSHFSGMSHRGQNRARGWAFHVVNLISNLEKRIMQRLVLSILAILLVLCLPCDAGTIANDTMSEVPFSFEKGYVIVHANIKGEKDVELILATGAEHSVVDSGLLNKYKLPSFYSGEGRIMGNSQDRIYFYSPVTGIRVGNIKGLSLSMRLGSLADASSRVGREIFGIFGADFFKGRVVQFDFRKKVVRFLPDSYSGTAKSITLPMSYYKEGVTLPIVENVTFDGKKIKTLLDTGDLTVLSLSPAAMKQLGLSPLPEKSEPRPDKISSLRFLDYEIASVPVLLYAKGAGFDRDIKEYGAVAGISLLQNFASTFDFRGKVVVLEPK